MYCERHRIALTTAENGTATGYSPVVTGRVLSVSYVKGSGAAAFTDGVDITITADNYGQAIVTLTNCNASTTVYPRVGVQDEAGADALYAAGGTKLREPVWLARDKVKVAVASGGDTKTGTIVVVIG